MSGTMYASDENIIKALKSGMSKKDICKKLRVGKRRLGNVAKGISSYRPSTARKKTSASRSSKGLEGFREMFDTVMRTQTALDTFLASDEFKDRGWIYDNELRDRLGVSTSSWVQIRKDYAQYQCEPRDPDTKSRKVVWGHIDIIEELREIARR
jgi:hypothetical protein